MHEIRLRWPQAGKPGFRIETEAEATTENPTACAPCCRKILFARSRKRRLRASSRASTVYFEQEIGLKAHIQREMPVFLTLRDGRRKPRWATAMACRPRRGATEPHLPADHRRHSECRPLCRARRRHPARLGPTLRPRPRARPLLSLSPRLKPFRACPGCCGAPRGPCSGVVEHQGPEFDALPAAGTSAGAVGFLKGGVGRLKRAVRSFPFSLLVLRRPVASDRSKTGASLLVIGFGIFRFFKPAAIRGCWRGYDRRQPGALVLCRGDRAWRGIDAGTDLSWSLPASPTSNRDHEAAGRPHQCQSRHGHPGFRRPLCHDDRSRRISWRGWSTATWVSRFVSRSWFNLDATWGPSASYWWAPLSLTISLGGVGTERRPRSFAIESLMRRAAQCETNNAHRPHEIRGMSASTLGGS